MPLRIRAKNINAVVQKRAGEQVRCPRTQKIPSRFSPANGKAGSVAFSYPRESATLVTNQYPGLVHAVSSVTGEYPDLHAPPSPVVDADPSSQTSQPD